MCVTAWKATSFPRAPTFVSSTGSSVIDIFISSPSLRSVNPQIPDLFHKLDSFPSHHRPILYSAPVTETRRPSFKLTNWFKYTTSLESIPTPEHRFLPKSRQDVDILLADFVSHIQRAINAATKATSSPVPILKEWWTPELSRLKAESLAVKLTGHPDYISIYKRYKASLQRTKRAHFRQTLDQLNSSTVYRYIKRRSSPPSLPPDELMNYFFAHPPPPPSDWSPPPSVDPQVKPITPCLLADIIRCLPKGKSPGHDNIRYEHLHHLPSTYVSHLASILDTTTKLGYFPTALKIAKVVFVDKMKPGTDGSSPSHYRPISLLPVIGKVLEVCIHRSIQKHTRTLNPAQFGFQTKISTVHALSRIHDFMKDRPPGNANITCAFDFAKAFDSISHEAILNGLARKNCPRYLLELTRSFLDDRLASFSASERTLHRGVPQGSVLAPTLFCYALDPLIDELITLGHNVTAYADDLTLQFSSSPDDIPFRLHACVSDLLKAADDLRLGLEISVPKSNALINSFSIITVPNSPIPIVQSLKILGITFDKNLNFNSHLKTIKTNILKSTMTWRSIAKTSYGITSDIRRLLYRSIVIPKFTYASPVFIDKITLKSNTKILLSLLRLFAISTTHSFAKAPSTCIIPLSKLEYPAFNIVAANNNLASKFPAIAHHRPLPERFPHAASWHPRLRAIYTNIDDLHAVFPNNPPHQLTQAITRHCRLGSYLSKFTNTSPFCPHCHNQPDTIAHLLFYCPHFSALRKIHLSRLTFPPFPSNNIFRYPSLVSSFLLSTKRLNF